MALSSLYIPFYYFSEPTLDKDSGLPLAAGVVSFFRDSQRATPKEVYTVSGTYPSYTLVSLGATLTLGLNGTFVDDDGNPIIIYAYPYDADGAEDLYYVTVESEGGVAQFVNQAVPSIPSSVIPPGQRTSNENEISNPQFAVVNFNPTGTTVLNLTGSGTVTPIAPDWDLVTSGTGTVTLERLQPTAANLDTNPPYILSILADSGLGSTIVLRQRMTNSPSLYRGEYVSAQVLAKVISGGASSLSMTYTPSTGSATTLIASTTISTTDYEIISGAVQTTQQVNTAAATGYVDIRITLPTSRTIGITSIQIVGNSDDAEIRFDEQPVARQKDHLFHYYLDAVLHQPKSSLLTGWNFALNPWQFRTPVASNVANNTYTADQTIVIQQAYVNSATANNVQVGRASHTANYAFQITAVTATNKVAVLQYIDPSTIRPYWGRTVSARVRASITKTAPNVGTVTFKCRLMYKAGLPGTISQTVPVSAWSAANNAIPTISGDGWTYLPTDNDATYTLSGTMTDFDFNGFTLPASSNANMTLGIAFIMMTPMETAGTPDVINIEEISLVRNDFAISAEPETYDEALRKCQFYYEKSYDVGTLPGTATSTAMRFQVAPMLNDGSTQIFAPKQLELVFKTVKRAAPTAHFYSNSTGTLDTVRIHVFNGGGTPGATGGTPGVNPSDITFSSYWTVQVSSTSNFIYQVATSTSWMTFAPIAGTGSYQGTIYYHYVLDSRMGV